MTCYDMKGIIDGICVEGGTQACGERQLADRVRV